MHNLCLACLFNFVEQSSWADLVHPLGLSEQEIKIGSIIRVELSIFESAIKSRDVADTPTVNKVFAIFFEKCCCF